MSSRGQANYYPSKPCLVRTSQLSTPTNRPHKKLTPENRTQEIAGDDDEHFKEWNNEGDSNWARARPGYVGNALPGQGLPAAAR